MSNAFETTSAPARRLYSTAAILSKVEIFPGHTTTSSILYNGYTFSTNPDEARGVTVAKALELRPGYSIADVSILEVTQADIDRVRSELPAPTVEPEAVEINSLSGVLLVCLVNANTGIPESYLMAPEGCNAPTDSPSSFWTDIRSKAFPFPDLNSAIRAINHFHFDKQTGDRVTLAEVSLKDWTDMCTGAAA